jgi:hypothetical protein
VLEAAFERSHHTTPATIAASSKLLSSQALAMGFMH